MVILGMGTNIGDRLLNLRRALKLVKEIPRLKVTAVSPIYISDALLPEGAPASWDMPHLNLAVRCETDLAPYALLGHIKNIEKVLGRTPAENWSPRIIDIDILAWDDLIQYDVALHIPHEHLSERPFALWPLADIAPDWIYPLADKYKNKTAAELANRWGGRNEGNAPLRTRQSHYRVDTSQLVGILNITPDSFSHDGIFATNKAITHAKALVAAGAEIIDVGAEATGPNASPISADQEWERLSPVLSTLMTEEYEIKPKISVDTYHPETAKNALALGVDWINDVSGGTNPAMLDVLAESTCDIVIMHHVTLPTSKEHIIPLDKNPVDFVYHWAQSQLENLHNRGIFQERIIFDIGLGFGKNAQQSLQLVKNIKKFQSLNTRLLVGHSRKSFLQQFNFNPAPERDLETVIMSLFLNESGVDYLRVHNTDLHSRAFKVAAAMNLAIQV